MTSWYSIISFLPDCITGERINIGVIVGADNDPDGEQTRIEFLKDWKRVEAFSPGSLVWIKPYTRDLRIDFCFWNKSKVEYAARNWCNSVQLTQPHLSTLSAEELLPRVVKRFLVQGSGETKSD